MRVRRRRGGQKCEEESEGAACHGGRDGPARRCPQPRRQVGASARGGRCRTSALRRAAQRAPPVATLSTLSSSTSTFRHVSGTRLYSFPTACKTAPRVPPVLDCPNTRRLQETWLSELRRAHAGALLHTRIKSEESSDTSVFAVP